MNYMPSFDVKKKVELIRILKREALQLGEIVFPNGERHKDDYYLHIKRGILFPDALSLIGEIITDCLLNYDVDGIAGQSVGAVPILSAVALFARMKSKTLFPLIVRKSSHEHGFGNQIEGHIDKVTKLVVLDDVIGSGKSMEETFQTLNKFGVTPLEAIVVVDRGNRGDRKLGIEVKSIINISELLSQCR